MTSPYADPPFDGFPRNAFQTILVDPPWRFATRSAKGLGKSPDKHYPTMTLSEIQALPVASLAAANSSIWLWGTSPVLDVQIEILKGWGFAYKGCAPWAKQSRSGRAWAFGTGYVFRSAAEFLLLGTKGAPSPQVRDQRNLIVAPVRQHSRKPDAARVMIERLYPGPRIELFSRESAPGWCAWGLETGKFDEVDV